VVVHQGDFKEENRLVQILNAGTQVTATPIKDQIRGFHEMKLSEPIVGTISSVFMWGSDIIAPNLKFQVGDHVSGVGILELHDDEMRKWKVKLADDTFVFLSEDEMVGSLKTEQNTLITTRYIAETEKFKSGDCVKVRNCTFEFHNGLLGVLTIYNAEKNVWQVRLTDVHQTIKLNESCLTAANIDFGFMDSASESGCSGYLEQQKILVLDMDHTILESRRHSPFPHKEAQHDFTTISKAGVKWYVRTRPGLKRFLDFCFEHFQVYVFTAAGESYASPILDIIDTDNRLTGRFFRQDCHTSTKWQKQKDIRLCCDDLSRVVFVDDTTSNSMVGQEHNLLPISRYYGDRYDRELQYLIPILWHAKDAIDVRPVIFSESLAGQLGKKLSFDDDAKDTKIHSADLRTGKEITSIRNLKKKEQKSDRKMGFAIIGSVFAHFCDPWANKPLKSSGI
jgi:Dullard-like phosphatase family protein